MITIKKQDLFAIMKEDDGTVIKYKDQFRKKTYYYEFDFVDYEVIHKKLFGFRNFFYLLASNGEHKYFSTLEEVSSFLDDKVEVGQIIDGIVKYGVCDKTLLLSLIEGSIDENRVPVSTTVEVDIPALNNHDSKPKKKTSLFGFLFSKKKPTKEIKRDWDEAYLEGKRIFEDTDETEEYNDDAESYADDNY